MLTFRFVTCGCRYQRKPEAKNVTVSDLSAMSSTFDATQRNVALDVTLVHER